MDDENINEPFINGEKRTYEFDISNNKQIKRDNPDGLNNGEITGRDEKEVK